MPSCAVKLCGNHSMKLKKPKGITYHVFPADPIVADRWASIIRNSRKESYWKPSKRTTVCSDHFNPSDLYLSKSGLRRVQKGAVPSKALYLSSKIDEDNDEEGAEISEKKDICTPSKQISGLYNKHESLPSTSELKQNEEFADIDQYLDTPKEAKLRKLLKKKVDLQKKHVRLIKILRLKNQRMMKKNANMKQILIKLKRQRYIENDVFNVLSENSFAVDLIKNLYSQVKYNKKRPMPKYTPELRKFCFTLHHCSAKAYKYVRSKLNFCLPHPKSLEKWYRNIKNGTPGITIELFENLELKSQLIDKTAPEDFKEKLDLLRS